MTQIVPKATAGNQRCRTMDFSQSDVLKIDVEGAHARVLFGRKCLLKSRRIQTIYFEQSQQRLERLGIAPGDVQKFLPDIGYNCHPMGANDTEWIAYFNKA